MFSPAPKVVAVVVADWEGAVFGSVTEGSCWRSHVRWPPPDPGGRSGGLHGPAASDCRRCPCSPLPGGGPPSPVAACVPIVARAPARVGTMAGPAAWRNRQREPCRNTPSEYARRPWRCTGGEHL
ncbi:hypothetical protein ACFFX0_28715 [Citricoccus parietis]|uniref:Uncharacterized protein n=1 Tax=Citricoccus parietis TaxID=592307 RepID=A0ABV5G7P2_9MICC